MPCKDRKGALDAFARWIRDGAPPEAASTAADNQMSLALMFAAIRSARRGGISIRVDEVLKEAP
jgi:predicted dehydrogenase